MTTVKIYDDGKIPDESIKFAVIAAKYQKKWVFCRHKQRQTWEIPGGHREAAEDVSETAKRELYEETGAVSAKIQPITVYGVTIDGVETYGELYYAEIDELGNLPESEIGETMLSDRLPENLTYPEIQPKLYECVQGWLNLQSNPDELWDVYDENRNLTGKTHRRGDRLREGEYHLAVHVWIKNRDGRYLITKRTPNKGYGNMWECTGGSALAGDDSKTAALREVREETGLKLSGENGRIVLSYLRDDFIMDVWLFEEEFSLSDVVYQENETCGADTASAEELLEMKKNGSLVPFPYLEEFFEKTGDFPL